MYVLVDRNESQAPMLLNKHQDVNQDGLGDIIVGAPGVGDNTGSAYIVFGSELFSEASYTLGSIGAAGSFVLSAPIEGGYGGFSVAGAGEL